MLADSYGRVATDLRVSLTDRCNLRCAYCMPPEGLDWLPSPELLTDDEVVRLIRVAVERLGVREVRFTGGEPLLRRGLAGIVARTAQLNPRPEISLTTNAIGLARTAGALHAAGLDRINVSLDTLRPETFRKLARRDRLPDVLDGMAAAAAAGLSPVKVNAVLMRDLNDDEAAPLLRFCLDRGYELRFIEQMPLDAQHGWKRAEMVTADEILGALGREFTLAPDDPSQRGSAPAEAFLVDGGPARVGVIAFWVLCLLALAGCFSPLARSAPRWIWAVPVLFGITVVLVNVETPRFREPIDPFLILLAACAIAWERGLAR